MLIFQRIVDNILGHDGRLSSSSSVIASIKRHLLRKGNMSRIDPRVRRTRRALQQSLLELVKEKPYETITIQEITQRVI